MSSPTSTAFGTAKIVSGCCTGAPRWCICVICAKHPSFGQMSTPRTWLLVKRRPVAEMNEPVASSPAVSMRTTAFAAVWIAGGAADTSVNEGSCTVCEEELEHPARSASSSPRAVPGRRMATIGCADASSADDVDGPSFDELCARELHDPLAAGQPGRDLDVGALV